MFYRPNYCCHCGEKVVRARWTPLTSRRFCEFCSVEQQQHDLLPRVGAAVAILIGLIGVTAYLSSGKTPSSSSTSAATALQRPVAQPRRSPDNNSESAQKTQQNAPTVTPPAANILQRAAQSTSSTEPVYYCGAMTKKGTACTRRVKTPGRCWQHQGQ
jgi:hypothetical protein